MTPGRFFAFILLLTRVSAGGVNAVSEDITNHGSKAIQSDSDLLQWIESYYLQPTPDLAIPAIRFILKERLLTTFDTQAMTTAFLSQLFRQNSDRLPGRFTQLEDLTQEDQHLLWRTVWRADTPEARALLRKLNDEADPQGRSLMKELLEKQPPDALTKDIAEDETGFDDVMGLWGIFFVTGDERCIQKTMSVLPWSEVTLRQGSKDADVIKQGVGGQAIDTHSICQAAQASPQYLHGRNGSPARERAAHLIANHRSYKTPS